MEQVEILPTEEKDGKLVSNFLDEQEVDKVLLAFAAARSDKGFTDDEAASVIAWANLVRMNEGLLGLILKGLLLPDLDKEGEMTFEMTKEASGLMTRVEDK